MYVDAKDATFAVDFLLPATLVLNPGVLIEHKNCLE